MHDILPEQSPHWQRFEAVLRRLMRSYAYDEIRFPVLEKTELFVRGIGEVTDIIEKEMYIFDDRNGDSLALRPEGTAGCVRACVENGLLHNQVQRLWYCGPMFRHERPQKGRYRQFHQFGVEAYGFDGPDIEAEQIMMTARLWRDLGLIDDLELQINSLGSVAARHEYRDVLVTYFTEHHDQLDEDSQRRLKTNPLRILDTKNPDMHGLVANAPKLIDYLDEESRLHFARLRLILDEAGIAYRVNPKLVRGLDYYEKTVFEWVTESLGAQGTVCAGGRYDGLVELLGGKPTKAVGFAMGMERLLSMIEARESTLPGNDPHVYLAMLGDQAELMGMKLAEQMRDALPELALQVNCGGGSFKSQLKKADRSGAPLALVIGEDEVVKQEIGVKFLREKRPQEALAVSDLTAFLQQYLDME